MIDLTANTSAGSPHGTGTTTMYRKKSRRILLTLSSCSNPTCYRMIGLIRWLCRVIYPEYPIVSSNLRYDYRIEPTLLNTLSVIDTMLTATENAISLSASRRVARAIIT